MNDGARTQPFYRPELDVLRFGAFLAVFVHHAFPADAEAYGGGQLGKAVAAALTAGGLGVDLFFALSAYLITELLIREHQQRGRIDVFAFYVRRALRIWPLYYAFLLLAFVVLPTFAGMQEVSPVHSLAFSLFVGNWSIAAIGWPPAWVSPLWSVSVEEQFYVAWPLLIAVLGVRRIPAIAVGCLLIATTMRITLAALGAVHPAVWTNTFARLDPIALAVVLRGRAPNLAPVVRIGLLIGGLGAWVVCLYRFGFDGWGSLVTYPVVAVASMGMLLAVLRPDGRRSPAARALVHPALVHLGRVSYGLYVFHVLALTLARRSLGGVFAPALVGFALTVGMALISYRVLEQPFLRLKRRRFTRIATAPAA
jgi:peptidoglycan/LPS O-acetylase OafA/YrhL